MSPRTLDKVTVFVTRKTRGALDVLLFEHPSAGVQIPAGTVEDGEAPVDAALREAIEESGLDILSAPDLLRHRDEPPPERCCCILDDTSVYSRPDVQSFDWARLRRGIQVRVERETPDFVQVTYREFDRHSEPVVTYQITGWVPRTAVTQKRQRWFFRIHCDTPTPPEWRVNGDVAGCRLFWASLEGLPSIVSPQDTWLAILLEHEAPRRR